MALFARHFDVPGGPDLPPATSPDAAPAPLTGAEIVAAIDGELGSSSWQSGGSVDHGGLTGLSDDDHAQYLRTDGTREMTGALLLDVMTTAAAPNSSIFIDSSTGKAYYKNASGTTFDLTAGFGPGPA